MKKVSGLLGLGLLGAVLISFTGSHKCGVPENSETLAFLSETDTSFVEKMAESAEALDLNINDITFIEEDQEIDLGFDTAVYLPKGFNAYSDTGLDLNDIVVVEDEVEIDLGFDTTDYLPLGFNAYEGMELKLDDIVYMEEEETIVLNFNVQDYLPENFEAASK